MIRCAVRKVTARVWEVCSVKDDTVLFSLWLNCEVLSLRSTYLDAEQLVEIKRVLKPCNKLDQAIRTIENSVDWLSIETG